MRIAILACLVLCSCTGLEISSFPPDASSTDAAPVPSDGQPPPPPPPPGPSRLLAIPPRAQWENANGFCGEMSIQSIALSYGAWISQQVARTVAGGELLLGVNEVTALRALHLDYTLWDSQSAQPQAERFLAWIKDNLQHGVPVIYAVYLSDAGNDADYDHIVPAVGIDATTFGGYDGTDRLAMNTNFGARITKTLASLPATRQSCAVNGANGGCVPRNVDYGVAVRGITDAQRATLPTTMTVAESSEPNVSIGEIARQMTATVTVSGLTAGSSYALLRYDDYRTMPTNATAAQFLASSHTLRTNFVATGPTFTFVDPVTFRSSGATYYRAVRL